MSDNGRPELVAFSELETLVHHLGEELAAFRRRALAAEARLKEMESVEGGTAGLEALQRAATLEEENTRLRAQLEAAMAKANSMLDRVRFLRQQAQGAEP